MSPVKQLFRSAGDTLLVVVGAQRIVGAVRRGTQWREDSRFEIALGGEPGLAGLVAAVRTMPACPGVGSMRVLVADNWIASASLPWSAALQRELDAQRAARARLALAGFEPDAHDTLRLDDAPFGAPRLVLAYPASLLAALAQAAAANGARLDSVLALSAAGWSLAGRAGALALLDEGLVVLARGRAGRLDELTVRSVAETSARSLQDAWQRQCLRDPQLAQLDAVPCLELAAASAPAPAAPFVPLALPEEDVAPALRLAAAATGRSALDAVAGVAPLPPRRAAVLAGAALLALAGGAYALQANAELQAVQQARQAAVPVAAAAPRAADWNRSELARVPAVNVAVRELNLPFESILRALEPPKDLRVAVLSMTTAASSSGSQASRVKIVAEARSGAEMARYVAFVAERKPFTGAYLVEHEIDETAAERPYRFSLEASWND